MRFTTLQLRRTPTRGKKSDNLKALIYSILNVLLKWVILSVISTSIVSIRKTIGTITEPWGTSCLITCCRRWFREEREQLSPVPLGERVTLLSAGLLRIGKVRLDDRGKYLCWVNNSAGEETVQVTLTVTGNGLTNLYWQIIAVLFSKREKISFCLVQNTKLYGFTQSAVNIDHMLCPDDWCRLEGDWRIEVRCVETRRRSEGVEGSGVGNRRLSSSPSLLSPPPHTPFSSAKHSSLSVTRLSSCGYYFWRKICIFVLNYS